MIPSPLHIVCGIIFFVNYIREVILSPSFLLWRLAVHFCYRTVQCDIGRTLEEVEARHHQEIHALSDFRLDFGDKK